MKNLICLIILVTYFGYTRAQVELKNNKVMESIYKREVTFIAGPCYGAVINENIKNDPYAETKNTFTPKFGFSYFIPTDKFIGYSVGLEYNRFIGHTAYKGYFRGETLLKDINGGEYYPLIEANYTSELKVNTLSIPLSIRFRKEIFKNIEFNLSAGLSLNVILSYRSYLNGVYNKKGLYPGFVGTGNNIQVYFVLENIPQLGFTNTYYANLRNDVESEAVAINALVSTGFKINTTNKSFVTINCYYLYGITDINSNNYRPTYVNVFEEKSNYKKNTLNQLSLNLGVGFNLN